MLTQAKKKVFWGRTRAGLIVGAVFSALALFGLFVLWMVWELFKMLFLLLSHITFAVDRLIALGLIILACLALGQYYAHRA